MKIGKEKMTKIRECLNETAVDDCFALKDCFLCETKVGADTAGGLGGVTWGVFKGFSSYMRLCDTCYEAVLNPNNRAVHSLMERRARAWVAQQRGVGNDRARH